MTSDTVWYSYPTASAGTIVDKNTTESSPANNVDNATESICPKGWTLPNKKQTNSNRATLDFNPVYGGYYASSILYGESARGRWWSSEAVNGALRYNVLYDDTGLVTGNVSRYFGLYIRCVSEEKTVTDLTYMQDMTPSIANWTPSTLADAEAFI